MTADAKTGIEHLTLDADDMVAEMSQILPDYLNTITTFGSTLHADLIRRGDTKTIYDGALISLRRILNFEVAGFILLDDEGLDCAVLNCAPEQKMQRLEAELENQISEGVFAWALQQNRPIIVPASDGKNQVLLGMLATRTNTLGMFLGIVNEKGILDAQTKMISIILRNCSAFLENLSLYKEISGYSHNLEEMVRERTRALTEAQTELESTNIQLKLALDKANKLALQAKRSDKAKSVFLAEMSNEIRTPMNTVQEMLTNLGDTNLSPNQREFTDRALKGSDSLMSVINEILDFSKIEAGKMTLMPEDFNLRMLVIDAIDLLRLKADEKGLKLSSLVHRDVPSLVFGDALRLRQIIVNLLGNAIKFTGGGEVGLKVTLEEDSETHISARFSISDTGIGIAEDKIQDLFKSFTQVEGANREPGGTGLGLVISKQLAEMMSGRIGVESEEGKGSTFWFTAALEKQSKEEAAGSRLAKDLTGQRVMLVDRSDANRYAMIEQLSEWGCYCDEASDAAEALYKLRRCAEEKNPFDMVLVEMQLSSVDGAVLGQMIKGCAELEEIAMVMTTSLGGRSDASRMRQIGFDAYLTKPISPSVLFDCLVTITAKRRLRSTTPSIVTKYSIIEARKREVRLLIVDDNTINQQVAMNFLEKLGYTADAVGNGKEAIRALSCRVYDLVLMDVEMPVMDGYETTRTIRDPSSRVLNHVVPIIATTANVTKETHDKCLAAGMDDYVSKPIALELLHAALERQLLDGEVVESLTVRPPHILDEEIFDRNAMLQGLENDAALCVEILKLASEEGPRQIKALRMAFENDDLNQISKKAHAAKNTFASIRANALWAMMIELENASKQHNLELARSYLHKLEPEFDKLMTALDEETRGSDIVATASEGQR